MDQNKAMIIIVMSFLVFVFSLYTVSQISSYNSLTACIQSGGSWVQSQGDSYNCIKGEVK